MGGLRASTHALKGYHVFSGPQPPRHADCVLLHRSSHHNSRYFTVSFGDFMTTLRLFVAGVVFSTLASTAALADDFHFSFGTPADPISGSGTLTATAEGNGEYLVTALTGTTNTGNGVNRPIQSLLPVGTFPTFDNGGYEPPNDNLLFFPSLNESNFDSSGLSYILGNGAQMP